MTELGECLDSSGKPDIEIYKPGMGRFTSRKTQEKREDQKSSPSESRDSSPRKKPFSKSSSLEEKKGKRNKKVPTEESRDEEEKPTKDHTEQEKSKTEEPPALTTPTEVQKDDQSSEQPAPAPAAAPRSKGYRANRVVKSKKKDPDVVE